MRIKLLQNPSYLRELVLARPPGSWIILDEIQLMPELLHEVHALSETSSYFFALSGSSARKLKRGQANLLAGRVILRHMYPLLTAEIAGTIPLRQCIERGCLPIALNSGDDWMDTLETYTLTYLREEIQLEALVRNLGNFTRFLQCAALVNGQRINLSNIARDAGVQRSTVQGYFQILQDTLLGTTLPAWRPKARIKEQAHDKFYWFDSGVARAMAGRLRYPIESVELGILLETFLLHEIKAYMHYQRIPGELFYWRTPSGTEVDIVWSANHALVGIEIKSNTRWRPEDGKGLIALGKQIPMTRKIGVYLGNEPLRSGEIDVLPLQHFLDLMYTNNLFVL